MPTTVLYPDVDYPDDSVERAIYGGGRARGDGARDQHGSTRSRDLRRDRRDGGLALRVVTARDFARFPRLRVAVRMGVGYDRIDRAAAARRGIMVCNVPDYGTTEVADHAIALALSLRRGLLLHHDAQRAPTAGAWARDTPRWCGAPRADLRHPRPGPHRHGGGAAGAGIRVPGDVLRPLPAERHRTGARHPARAARWRSCCARRMCCRVHAR